MIAIQATTNTTPLLTTPKASSPDTEALPGTDTRPQPDTSLHISAEAQYLFKLDAFLSDLDDSERDQALAYLSRSEDTLQQKAARYFEQSQHARAAMTENQKQNLLKLRDQVAAQGHELGAGFRLDDSTKVVVTPLATPVFRLDGKSDFYPVQLNHRNQAFPRQLDELTRTAYAQLDNQDAENLVGSLRHALDASENIMLSTDDLLHLHYSADKAREAIAAIAAPAALKSALTSLLKEGLQYQDEKQSRFIADTQAFIGDSRVGIAATEDVRLARAAQTFNREYEQALAATHTEVINSGGMINTLLAETPELIRFTPDKIEAALNFYQQDFANFQKVLRQDYSQPEFAAPSPIDKTQLVAGSDYALGVIEQIQRYVSLNR